jgi:hypothetical protein
VIFAHGAQLVRPRVQEHGAAFKQMGMPPPVGALVILAQFLGSLGLIVGLLTRIAAFGILVVMLGAIFLVHTKVGFFMNWYGQQQAKASKSSACRRHRDRVDDYGSRKSFARRSHCRVFALGLSFRAKSRNLSLL